MGSQAMVGLLQLRICWIPIRFHLWCLCLPICLQSRLCRSSLHHLWCCSPHRQEIADSEPEAWYGAYGYASPYTYGGYGSYGYSAYRPYTYGRVYGAYNGYY